MVLRILKLRRLGLRLGTEEFRIWVRRDNCNAQKCTKPYSDKLDGGSRNTVKVPRSMS